MRRLLSQILRFVGISGVGWLLDFSIFWALTSLGGLSVASANMLSSVPAITLVFCVSTYKIFQKNRTRLPLFGKYLLYFGYQMALVFCVSWLGQWLFGLLSGTALADAAVVGTHLELVCKILITPITMAANFCVMKVLSEKL